MRLLSKLKSEIKEKIFRTGYGFHNYPNKILSIKKINKRFNIKKISFKKKLKKTNPTINLNINLASFKIIKDSFNLWSSADKFKDIEDVVSAHRWIWVYQLLDEKKISLRQKKIFINESINNWFYLYGTKKLSKFDPIFEPYTISERLVVYVFLVKMGFVKKNIIHLNLLKKQFIFLTENIEFFYKKDSNHVLNNLRSILIFAKFIDSKVHLNFFSEIFKDICNKYLDNFGFFIFGSSHYQFIFSRWIIDIFINNIETKFLSTKVLNILSACKFFENEFNNKTSIPCFGNISPDYTPSYIVNFLSNILIKNKFNNNNEIFKNFYHQEFQKKFLKRNLKSIKNHKEWKKISNNNISLYARNPNSNGFHFNHSHNDFFNFILFIKNQPLIVNFGKKNYSKISEKYKQGKFHNSFEIEKKNIFDELYFNKIKNYFSQICKNYKVREDYEALKFDYKNKKFEFFRDFKIINKKKIILKNSFKSINLTNLKLNFFFSPEIKFNLKKNFILITINKQKIKMNIFSTTKYKMSIFNNNKKKISDPRYGIDPQYVLMKIVFKNQINANCEIKFEVIN